MSELKKIRRFPSGAVRSDDSGRICPHYISPYALKAVGEHFMNASNDFGATNYYLGITPKDCLGSMMRHYLDLAIAIEENNIDAIREELKAYVANGIMALHQVEIERKGLYKEVYEKTEIIELRKEENVGKKLDNSPTFQEQGSITPLSQGNHNSDNLPCYV